MTARLLISFPHFHRNKNNINFCSSSIVPPQSKGSKIFMVGDGESLPKGMEKGREQKFHEDSSFTSQNRTKTENEGLS